jgi:hypothetical protein
VEPDLKKFIGELNNDVHEQLSDVGGDASAFTEMIMEHLSDNGIVENPSVAAFHGRIGRGNGRLLAPAAPGWLC